MTIGEARAKAHQQYDDCMFCPGCSKLLTGLHMGSRCYTNWIERKAQQILENSKKSHDRRKWGAYHHRAGNSSNNRNRDRLSHGRSQKQTQVICAE